MTIQSLTPISGMVLNCSVIKILEINYLRMIEIQSGKIFISKRNGSFREIFFFFHRNVVVSDGYLIASILVSTL